MAKYYVDGMESNLGKSSIYTWSVIMVKDGEEKRWVGYKICSPNQKNDFAIALGCKASVFLAKQMEDKDVVIVRGKHDVAKRYQPYQEAKKRFSYFEYDFSEVRPWENRFSSFDSNVMNQNVTLLKKYNGLLLNTNIEKLKKDIREYSKSFTKERIKEISNVLGQNVEHAGDVLGKIITKRKETFERYVSILHQIEEDRLTIPHACYLYKELKNVKNELNAIRDIEILADETLLFEKTPFLLMEVSSVA